MVYSKLLFLFLGYCLLLGCQKDRIELEWTRVPANVDGHFNKIGFDSEGNGYLVGGLDWYLGTWGSSSDGGLNWRFDSLSNKRLYDLFIGPEEVYAVGVDGYMFSKGTTDESWNFHRLPRWDINRGVAFRSDGLVLIGGGAAFGNGILNTYQGYTNPETEYELSFEISDVTFSNDKIMHAVGYGVILRSLDDGENWILSDVDEDFFQAIQFVDEQTGYVIGLTGNILKTTDAGASWTYLRNSSSAAVKNYPFRDLYFSNEKEGYICGDRGLLWFTKDGGDHWTEVKDLPRENFLSVSTYGDNGFLVGEDGVLIRFVLP